MSYWNYRGIEVALIIVICIIGFVLICCATAAIWFTMAQRNRKARIPRNPMMLNSGDGKRYTPYIGMPAEPKVVMEGGHSIRDKAGLQQFYRDMRKPGTTITSV